MSKQVVILGGHPGQTGVDLHDLVWREITVLGSMSHCQADFDLAARAITAGELKYEPTARKPATSDVLAR